MTTTKPNEGRIMIDRADTEATLYRVAICAFTYYPGKPWEEPGYSIDEDIAWCTAPLAGLPQEKLTALGASIRSLITDPGADRRSFISTLARLADEKE